MQEINGALEELNLVTAPPITVEMPLRAPRIRFKLKQTDDTDTPEDYQDTESLDVDAFDPPLQDIEESYNNLSEPTFRVSELASSNREVLCISTNASIKESYTMMLLKKYSHLVVADNEKPMQQAIKGIVSFSR